MTRPGLEPAPPASELRYRDRLKTRQRSGTVLIRTKDPPKQGTAKIANMYNGKRKHD